MKRISRHHKGRKEEGEDAVLDKDNKREERKKKRSSRVVDEEYEKKEGTEKAAVNGNAQLGTVYEEKPKKKDKRSSKNMQNDVNDKNNKGHGKRDKHTKERNQTKQDDINNNNVTRRSKEELTADKSNHIKHQSSFRTIPVEEWDPHSEEYLV